MDISWARPLIDWSEPRLVLTQKGGAGEVGSGCKSKLELRRGVFQAEVIA